MEITVDLTAKRKAEIDAMTYEQLLFRWRSAPAGDPWFQGETGTYWGDRMKQLRAYDPADAVAASKRVGWE